MSGLKFINLPPVWLLGCMALAWAIATLHAPWGESFVWFGRVMIGASLALMVWAAMAFRRARTTIVPHLYPSALVETGPFRYSRNPIYLADIVILAGWCVSLGSPLALITLGPLYAALLYLFILPEEARLSATLGAPYTAYRARVRRWF